MGSFYQVAAAHWFGSPPNTRDRAPYPGVDETVMYSNLRKNVGTITWYGAVALPENAAPKLLVDKKGNIQNNVAYRGEVYCAAVQSKDCDIEQFVVGYNRLIASMGPNFTAPARIIFNFNYDPRWNSTQGTVVNHSGLLAVELSGSNYGNREIILNYSDRLFLIGLGFFLIGIVVWPIWYFRYRRGNSKSD